MPRSFLLLVLAVVAAGSVFLLLPTGAGEGSPVTDPVSRPVPFEERARASLVVPATKSAQRVEVPAAAAPPAAQDPQTDVEHRAIVAIVPKGQRDKPIAEFDFEVVQARPFGMNRWRTVRALARGKTGHDGRATLTFRGPEILQAEERNAQPLDSQVYLCARLCEPGYQERFVPLYRENRQEHTGPFVATIEAQPGGTIRGRLVNQDGQPVHGELMFVRSADLHTAGYPRKAGRRESDPDGRFLLHVNATPDQDTSGMLQGACLAWASGVGTGAIADASWPIDDLPQDLEITVRGPGALRGLVRDPSDRPAAGLDLILARVDVMGPGVEAHAIGTPAAPFLRDDGFFSTWVRTDAQGRFAAKGLSLAEYSIYLKQGHVLFQDSSVTLTDMPVLADGTELELTYQACGLVVQLVAEDGAPWPGGLSLVDARMNQLPLPHNWPERPAVLAYPAEQRAGAWVCASDDPSSRCRAKSLGGGAVQIDTGGARDLLVCVIGGNEQDGMFCGPPRHVAMGHGETSFSPTTFQVHTLTMGQLAVDAQILNAHPSANEWRITADGEYAAVDPNERKPVPHAASETSRLLIEHSATHMPLMEAEHSFDTSPYRFTLPPAGYTARAWNDLQMGSADFALPVGHGASSAVVRPGKTTTLDLALDGGEKLVLRVKADEPSGAVETPKPWARLRLEYEDGPTLPVYHLHVTRYSVGDVRRGYSDAWAAGETHSTTPLPIGRGRIRGRLTVTGREIDAPVEIVRGQPLTLTL